VKEGLHWMRELNFVRGEFKIREVVAEASEALAQLDAGRLEELALACRVLNRVGPNESQPDRRSDGTLLRQVRDAAVDIRVFGRMLEATRANLVVMRRLRQLRQGKIEYSEAQALGWAPPEPGYGDD
jgi:hypothetical protein